MNITDLLNSPACERLLMTFAHFLWQGLAIAGVVALGSLWLRRSSAHTRYSLFAAALLLMALCAPVTFQLLGSAGVTGDEQYQMPNDPESLAVWNTGASGPAGEFSREQIGESTGETIAGPASGEPRLPTNRPQRSQAASSQGDVLSRLVIPGLTAAYLIGACMLLGRLFLGLRNGSILRRRSRAVEDAGQHVVTLPSEACI